MATKMPLTMTPSSDAPSAAKAEALEPEISQHAEIDDDGGENRQERRNDHFLDRRLGQNVHGARVIRTVGSGHDARLFLELAANFLDDRTGGAADGCHGDAAEQVGNEAAEDESGDYVRVGEVKRNLADALEVGKRVEPSAFACAAKNFRSFE